MVSIPASSTIKAPLELLTAPMQHQRAAQEHLGRLRIGGLFMDPGTGKTRTVIGMIQDRWEKIDRVVYICPVNTLQNVQMELHKHIKNPKVCVFTSSTRVGKIPEADFYVVGLESFSQSSRVTLATHSLITENTLVVVDEGDLIKGHTATRTKRITLLGKKARYRFLLTGSAACESYGDLFSQMYFLSPKILGYHSYYSFSQNHLEFHKDYPELVVRNLNTDLLTRKIQPYVFQIKKEECVDLPKKKYCTHYFSMTHEQRTLYHQAKMELLSMPAEDFRSHHLFKLFTALREICSGYWHDTATEYEIRRGLRSGHRMHTVEHDRINTLRQVLRQVPEGERVVVWSVFHHSIRQMVADLGMDHEVFEFHGALPLERRMQNLQGWRDTPGGVLVASPRCGGRGLTLNECAFAVFYDHDFPYRVRLQGEDRIHRIGQDREVTYFDLVCRDSMDERIHEALSRKENLMRTFQRKLGSVPGRSGLIKELRKL